IGSRADVLNKMLLCVCGIPARKLGIKLLASRSIGKVILRVTKLQCLIAPALGVSSGGLAEFIGIQLSRDAGLILAQNREGVVQSLYPRFVSRMDSGMGLGPTPGQFITPVVLDHDGGTEQGIASLVENLLMGLVADSLAV